MSPHEQSAGPKANTFLLLDPQDNILVCIASTAQGVDVLIDGQRILLRETIEVGHKVARRALFKGDKVLRYGFPIGTMMQDASLGAHVHQHNLKSDYLPAHGRGGTEQTGEA